MLAKEILSHRIPIADIHDPIAHVPEADTWHPEGYVAINRNGLFWGLLHNSALRTSGDKTVSLVQLQNQVIRLSVKPEEHILNVLQVMDASQQSCIAVIDEENQFVGEIIQANLIHALAKYLSVDNAHYGKIILSIPQVHYNLSEIVRIVQSNDATIYQLNTRIEETTGLLIATITISRKDISSIVATFQRYEYDILNYFGDELFDNTLKENYDLLMKYIHL